ncbi:MAG: SurA N-terminal domain-containing protein [Pseudobdellovibrio sp.]
MNHHHQQTFIDQIKKSLKGDRGLNAKAIVAILIFGAIILSFILSDYGNRQSGSMSMGSAAEVNGEIITLKEFQEQENRLSTYYAQMFGGKIDNEFQRKQIAAQALGELVNNSLAAQGADKEKIFATDGELKKVITEDLPYFKKDGVFQSDLYRNLLSANRLTPGEFEKGLRQQIKTQKLRKLFELGLSESKLEKELTADLKSKQLNVAYVKLNSETFKNTNLVNPEVVNKSLLDDQFAQRVKNYYETNKAEFESQEQVKASHILIRIDEQDPQSEAKAKAKAQEVLKRVQKENFGKVAAQVSDDPGSKAKNGELGYFTRGKMVKEFEDTAFSLPVGKISELVKTPFGYHIIKVEDKKPATITSFDAAKHTIAKKLLSEEKYTAAAKSIEEAASKDEATLNEVLKKNDLQWTESGYFDLATEQFPGTQSASLFEASLKLNKIQPVSKYLVRDGDSQYLLKLVDIKTVEVKPDPKNAELQQRDKAVGSFSKWVADLRKKASIHTNNQLLQ